MIKHSVQDSSENVWSKTWKFVSISRKQFVTALRISINQVWLVLGFQETKKTIRNAHNVFQAYPMAPPKCFKYHRSHCTGNISKCVDILFRPTHTPTKNYSIPHIPLVSLKYFPYFSGAIPQSHKPTGWKISWCLFFKPSHSPTNFYHVPHIPLVSLKYFLYFSGAIPQSHKSTSWKICMSLSLAIPQFH